MHRLSDLPSISVRYNNSASDNTSGGTSDYPRHWYRLVVTPRLHARLRGSLTYLISTILSLLPGTRRLIRHPSSCCASHDSELSRSDPCDPVFLNPNQSCRDRRISVREREMLTPPCQTSAQPIARGKQKPPRLDLNPPSANGGVAKSKYLPLYLLSSYSITPLNLFYSSKCPTQLARVSSPDPRITPLPRQPQMQPQFPAPAQHSHSLSTSLPRAPLHPPPRSSPPPPRTAACRACAPTCSAKAQPTPPSAITSTRTPRRRLSPHTPRSRAHSSPSTPRPDDAWCS